MLIGPINHIKHLVSKERLPFSIAYLTSLGLTLYFSLGVRSFQSFITFLRSLTLGTQIQSYLGSLIGAIVQVRLPIQHVAWSSSVLTFSVYAGHRTRFIRTRLLPRRHADAALRRPDGAARGRQLAPVLILGCQPSCTRTYRSLLFQRFAPESGSHMHTLRASRQASVHAQDIIHIRFSL